MVSFLPTQELAANVQAVYAMSGLLFVTQVPNGNISEYAVQSQTSLEIGGPGRTFAIDVDGNVWGVSPEGTELWKYSGSPMQWSKIFTVPNISIPITQIAAASGTVYVLMADASLHVITNGSASQIGTAAAIATDLLYLYALNEARDTVTMYSNGTWTTIIASGADTLQQLMAAGTAAAAVGNSGNVYLWRFAQASTAPPCAPAASYALTVSCLVGFADGTEFFYDPDQNNWIMAISSLQDLQLVSGGAYVYGLSGGSLYLLAEYSSWMTNLEIATSFGQKSLGQICIPGTHDSGSYAFEGVSAVTIPVTMTQGMSISDQLNAGARFLDIRPQWDSGQADYYFVHGSIQTSVRASDAFSQIETFLTQNPGEIVFVYLNHLSNIGGTADTLATFLNDVIDVLGKHLAPPAQFSAASTVSSLVSSKTTLVAIIDAQNVPVNISSKFWTNSQINYIDTYANTSSVAELQQFVSQALAANNNAASLWLLQCQLTPPDSVGTFIEGAAGQFLSNIVAAFSDLSIVNVLKACSPAVAIAQTGSPAAMAATSKSAVQSQLSPGNSGVNGLNLFIVDFYDTSWTDLAIANNVARI